MKYQININQEAHIISIVNFQQKEVLLMTEGKHPAEQHFHLFYNYYNFDEIVINDFAESDIVFIEYENGCITINTDIEPCGESEQKIYHNYDTEDYDECVNFWKEVYGNKVS
jgi:hypothetical protein